MLLIGLAGRSFSAGQVKSPQSWVRTGELGTVPILFGPGFALRQTIWMRYNIPPVYRHI
jgi:hypothetical protein